MVEYLEQTQLATRHTHTTNERTIFKRQKTKCEIVDTKNVRRQKYTKKKCITLKSSCTSKKAKEKIHIHTDRFGSSCVGVFEYNGYFILIPLCVVYLFRSFSKNYFLNQLFHLDLDLCVFINEWL